MSLIGKKDDDTYVWGYQTEDGVMTITRNGWLARKQR